MDEAWPLVVGILSFLFGVVSAVGTVLFRAGGQAEKIRALEASVAKLDGELTVAQAQLAKGDARFAGIVATIEAMKTGIDEIKALLTAAR